MKPIDFAWLDQQVELVAILGIWDWDWNYHVRGQYRGPCPIHQSTSPRSRCFSVNTELNLFRCFKCGAKGGPINLWAQRYGLPPLNAAYELCHVFNLEPRFLERGE